MATYNVHFLMGVTSVVTVEATGPAEAIKLAAESEDMPGSMGYRAFGSASVDESGDWEPIVVTDSTGTEVWTAEKADAALTDSSGGTA
jgi:hypothetical protein